MDIKFGVELFFNVFCAFLALTAVGVVIIYALLTTIRGIVRFFKA